MLCTDVLHGFRSLLSEAHPLGKPIGLSETPWGLGPDAGRLRNQLALILIRHAAQYRTDETTGQLPVRPGPESP